jgi:hypothetical protein
MEGFTVVNVDEVIRLKERIKKINNLEIDKIMFVDDDGFKIEVKEKDIEEWKFSGLNISDFVMFKLSK